MRFAAFLFVMVTVASVSSGQVAPVPAPFGGAVPHIGGGLGLPPIPRPAAPHAVPQPACPRPVAAPASGATARLEHLVQAAVHLEAAGELQQAQQVRQLVARERQLLLNRLGEMPRSAAIPQVLLHVRVIEVSRTKLAKLGFEWTAIQNDNTISSSFGNVSAATFQVLDDNKGLLGMLDALRKDKLVRVLAEPTLVTVSGRPAHFQTGGEIPVAGAAGQDGDGQRPTEFGTRVDLVPLVTNPDKIRLEMKISVVEPVGNGPTRSGEHPVSALRRLNIDTGVEMNSGQTVVMSGFSTYSKDRDETIETLVLITSEIVNAS